MIISGLIGALFGAILGAILSTTGELSQVLTRIGLGAMILVLAEWIWFYLAGFFVLPGPMIFLGTGLLFYLIVIVIRRKSWIGDKSEGIYLGK